MRRWLATKTALVSILTRNQMENEKILPEADTIVMFFSKYRTLCISYGHSHTLAAPRVRLIANIIYLGSSGTLNLEGTGLDTFRAQVL